MKQINTFIKLILPAITAVMLFAGCHKTEFMPPPEGEKIPYTSTATKDLTTILSTSAYKLFNAAWQRSTVRTEQAKNNVAYTLLVPSDAALQGAGYTADAISKMAVNDVDSLVRYYTVRNKVSKENLAARNSNYEGISLHFRADLTTKYYYGDGSGNTSSDPYYYRHFLGIDNGKLLINGVAYGSVDAGVEATNGYIWPIDRVVPKPDKSFLQALESDPRFSMVLDLQRRADEVYTANFIQLYIDNLGFDPGMDYNHRDYLAGLAIMPYQAIRLNMIFVPTNDAFKAAGFNSVDEILEWNKRAPAMFFDFDTYDVGNKGVPTDTLLAYNWDFGRENLPYTSQGKAPNPSPTIFYANDLRNDLLGNYQINYYPGYVNYTFPFSFTKNSGGQLQMQVTGSTAPQATVVETINTLMGPIHVIDRLLVPKNFKLK